eukprot:gene374-6788_t
MSFSLLNSVTFTVVDYSFGISPDEIKKVIDQKVKMVFNDNGTVDFLGTTWKEAKVVEDGYKNILYLITDVNKRIFRITLIVKKDTKDFMDSFLSGDVRVREDGDFFLKSLLRPVHYDTLRKNPIEFTIKDNSLIESVLSWSHLELCEKLVENKIIDDDDAKILIREKVDGRVFLEMNESELKEIGLRFGPRKRLMDVINKL